MKPGISGWSDDADCSAADMTYTQNLWLFFVLLFGIIVVPGMDMLYVVGSALSSGRRAGAAATAGVMTGGVVHTVFGLVGVAVLFRLAPVLLPVMLLAGAGYMIWIGASLARSRILVGTISEDAVRPLWRTYWQGAVTCLLNPKAYLFVFSVYPQFLRPEFGALWLQALAMGCISILTQLGVYGGMALVASQTRNLLTSNPGATVLVGKAAGCLFIAAGIWVGWHALANVRG